MTATVDGQKTIDRLLQAGERQTIDVQREIALTAGDATAFGQVYDSLAPRLFGYLLRQTRERVARRSWCRAWADMSKQLSQGA